MLCRLIVVAILLAAHRSDAKASAESHGCAAGDACESTDTVALLQHTQIHKAMLDAASRGGLDQLSQMAVDAGSLEVSHALAQLASGLKAGQAQPPVNCEKTPALCSELLNCKEHPVNPFEMMGWSERLATPSGHANLRLWCVGAGEGPRAIGASEKVGHCLVDHDLATTASSVYAKQLKNANVSNAQAAYCFNSGFCEDTEIDFTTTQAQAEEICSQRYPRWNTFGYDEVQHAVKGKSDKGEQYMAMTACAMGVYQCDVALCKATYCQSESYKSKFAKPGTGATKPESA